MTHKFIFPTLACLVEYTIRNRFTEKLCKDVTLEIIEYHVSAMKTLQDYILSRVKHIRIVVELYSKYQSL